MISVIVVNYNSGKWFRGLQESLAKQTNQDFELIFIDNASTDDSLSLAKEIWPTAIFIENDENLGFAKANNQGIKIARGDKILLLNPDVELFEDTFALLCSIDWGDIVGGINMPLEKKAYIDLVAVKTIFGEKPVKSHMVSGSLMMINKYVIDKIGGLDESFFLYWEDTEYCYNALTNGFSVVMAPIPYYHYSGGSSNLRKNNYRADYNYFKSNMLFEYMRGKTPSLPVLIAGYNTLKLKFKWKALTKAWRDYQKERHRKEYPNFEYKSYVSLKKKKDLMANKLNEYYKLV